MIQEACKIGVDVKNVNGLFDLENETEFVFTILI